MKRKQNTSKVVSVMAFVKIVAFLTPPFVYLFIILFAFPAPNSGFIALGGFGSFLLGLGFVNLTGIIDKMYLGHIVTGILMFLGILLVGISSAIMYSPTVYSQLNEDYVSFYVAVWSFLFVSGIYYPFFRSAIHSDLRSCGMSKTNIKKHMNGVGNFWWYNSLKGQFSQPWVFVVNKLFTILFPVVCLLHLLLGWCNAISICVLVSVVGILLLDFGMGLFIVLQRNQTSSNRRNRFSIGIYGVLFFPIVASTGLIIYFIKYM